VEFDTFGLQRIHGIDNPATGRGGRGLITDLWLIFQTSARREPLFDNPDCADIESFHMKKGEAEKRVAFISRIPILFVAFTADAGFRARRPGGRPTIHKRKDALP
jgi:hypothetical protein